MKRERLWHRAERAFRENLILNLWRFVRPATHEQGISHEVVLARHRLLVDEVLYLAEMLPNPMEHSAETLLSKVKELLRHCKSDNLQEITADALLCTVRAAAQV